VRQFDNGFLTNLIYNYFIEGGEFDNGFLNMNLKVLKVSTTTHIIILCPKHMEETLIKLLNNNQFNVTHDTDMAPLRLCGKSP